MNDDRFAQADIVANRGSVHFERPRVTRAKDTPDVILKTSFSC